MGVMVAGVVGLVGLVQWDQGLMLLGIIAALVVVAVSAVASAARYWHMRNVDPGASYVGAEDVVRLRSPRTR